MGIIYQATFENGKKYIGYSKHALDKRKREHIKAANNGSEFLFHKAIRKYGEETIQWDILEESDDLDYLLDEAENHWIIEQESHHTCQGYNMTIGGQAGSNQLWWSALQPLEKDLIIEKLKENLSLSRYSDKRFESIRKSWEDAPDRKRRASERFKKRWSDKTTKKELGDKISQTQKENWKNGVYDKSGLIKATAAAKDKVSGSVWYNDGIRNFRLKVDDPRVENLTKGKI